MFELPEDFDQNAPLTLCALASKLPETNVVMIGTDIWGSWETREEGQEHQKWLVIFMRETTYKMHKKYVSGAKIDMIQTLGSHRHSTFTTGVDEEGDLYWDVSFKVDDFNTIYPGTLKEKS